ncbi:MAG: valine--tRNA ligase, partial [Candidatus Cloacimonadaceae bacterium]
AELFDKYQTYLQGLAKVEELNTGVDIQKPRACLAAVVRNIEIFMPLSGLIDIEAEKQRLGKQVEKIEKELASIEAKLNNPNFVNNAKAEVVEDHRKRREDVEVKLTLTKELLADL